MNDWPDNVVPIRLGQDDFLVSSHSRGVGSVKNLTQYPLIKWVLISLLLALSMIVLRHWMGAQPSPLIIAALCLAAALIAGSALITAPNPWPTIKRCALLSVIVLFFGVEPIPSSPEVAPIQYYFGAFAVTGLIAVWLFKCILVIVDVFLSKNGLDMEAAARPLLEIMPGIAVYSVGHWLLGIYGPDIESWIALDPVKAATLGFSVFLAVIVVWCACHKHSFTIGIGANDRW